MVEEIGLQRKTQKKKMLAIRKALYKYGDIPSYEVNKATVPSKANEWVAVFDKNGNVLSAGRVKKTLSYLKGG